MELNAALWRRMLLLIVLHFLKNLLEYNRYTVVVVPSPQPKVAAAPAAVSASTEVTQPATPNPQPVTPNPQPVTPNPQPETFTIGVTDTTFNPTNAIFGRLLHTQDGHVVTLAYWEQKETTSNDEIPYFENIT